MKRHTYILPASVDRVIDGDTIVVHLGIGPGLELHGVHVRIEGINAPEVRAPGGPEARDYARSLLPEGTEITLTSTHSDKYGRLLAFVMLEASGLDFGFAMVEAGHAVSRTSSREESLNSSNLDIDLLRKDLNHKYFSQLDSSVVEPEVVQLREIVLAARELREVDREGKKARYALNPEDGKRRLEHIRQARLRLDKLLAELG